MASADTLTRQQWWEDLATELTKLPVCDVAVRRGGRTQLQHRRSLTGKRRALALVVDRHDLDAHTGTDAGRWILTQQAALVTAEKPRLVEWGRRLQRLLFTITVLSGWVALLLSGPWQLLAVVTAVLCGLGGAWIWRERRHERLVDVLAADHTATAACGGDAALAALTSRPSLYRSKFHAVLEQRDPISCTNRVDRIQAHR